MYCGERYPTLSHVSICPCDKFSNIPPSENTGNKTVATGEQVGVVDSVGDALFNQSLGSCEFSKSEEIDDSACLCCTSSICEFKTSLYAESGIFSRAE